MEYLKIAQDLEMFGIAYFPVMNARGSNLILGIDSLGINFYDETNKLAPKGSFPWSEINRVAYTNSKFTVSGSIASSAFPLYFQAVPPWVDSISLQIRFTDRKTEPFKVRSKNHKVCKKIFLMATGNHEMYKRRRLPDPLDVQQMKVFMDTTGLRTNDCSS